MPADGLILVFSGLFEAAYAEVIMPARPDCLTEDERAEWPDFVTLLKDYDNRK